MPSDLDPGEWASHHFALGADAWHRLQGGSFWITGSGSGLGRALATALALAGAEVFLTGRRPSMLHQTIEGVGALGGTIERCHAVPADITNQPEVVEAATYIRAHSASLVGLVNNAAMPQRAMAWPLHDEEDDFFDRMLRLNVSAQWRVTREILPHMVRAGRARILFVTSAAGWSFNVGAGHYNVSKAALNSLAASVAAECQARYPEADLQINALDPGEMRSEMNQGGAVSAYAAVPVALRLLSHGAGGPTGRFFDADGRSRTFGTAPEYRSPLL